MGQVLTDRGGSVTFEATAADTGGRLLSTRSQLPAGFPAPPRHVHPRQAEHFEVLAGRLVVEAGGVHRLLTPGDALTVPAGTPHRFAVPGPGPVDVRVTFTPAGDMEGFLERAAGLARAGQISDRGWPAPRPALRLALLHRHDLRPAGAPGAALGLLTGIERAVRHLRR